MRVQDLPRRLGRVDFELDGVALGGERRGRRAGTRRGAGAEIVASAHAVSEDRECTYGGRYGSRAIRPSFMTKTTWRRAEASRERVSGDGDEIGEPPRSTAPRSFSRPRTRAATDVAAARAAGAGIPNSIISSISRAFVAVREDSGVAAVRDRDPGRERAAEHLASPRRGASEARGPAATPVARHRLGRGERGAEDDALLLHERELLRGRGRAVLDRADAALDRALDAFVGRRVRGDGDPGRVASWTAAAISSTVNVAVAGRPSPRW